MPHFDSHPDWERSVILELNREHEYLCHTRKIKLRPIAIRLFDSESHWGRFDELTWTISISRRLVREFSWHQVLGVLRHEMAHQLVAETYPQAGQSRPTHGRPDGNRPHDARFAEACRRLGVPDQYAKAGLDLTTCDIDWRTEKRDEATERILEKVQKLLALANSGNEHEAFLAMERVREIYARYNLEQSESSAAAGFVHLVITHRKKRMESWEQKTVSILIEHFFVKIVIQQLFDAESGEHHHAIEIVGTRENVLMAEYVYHFLLNQVEFLLKQAVSAAGIPFSRRQRNSYRVGILTGFASKLKAAEKKQEKKQQSPAHGTASQSPDGTKDLALVGKAIARFQDDPRLEDYLAEVYPRLRNTRARAITINADAFAAGRQAGATITLHKPVNGKMENRGHVLTGSSAKRS